MSENKKNTIEAFMEDVRELRELVATGANYAPDCVRLGATLSELKELRKARRDWESFVTTQLGLSPKAASSYMALARSWPELGRGGAVPPEVGTRLPKSLKKLTPLCKLPFEEVCQVVEVHDLSTWTEGELRDLVRGLTAFDQAGNALARFKATAEDALAASRETDTEVRGPLVRQLEGLLQWLKGEGQEPT